MADSEAPGIDRRDEPADTDRLAVIDPDEAPEDQDPPAELEFTPVAAAVADDADDEYRFDAFDQNTWHFEPAAAPWYRGWSAVFGIVAVVVGLVALVVSVGLLASRPDDEQAPVHQSSAIPTPSSATPTATVPETSSAEAPPAPPPPPPPPPPPAPAQQAPAPVPRSDPRPAKKPEINVTRAPMSVAPQQRGPSR